MSDVNPYESPPQPVQSHSRRGWTFALVFAVIVLGGIAGFQYVRFQALREQAVQAMRAAEAAQAQAEKSAEAAREALRKLDAEQRPTESESTP